MGLERLTMTTDEHRRVVIDAQEVDRRGDDGEVAVLDCASRPLTNRRSVWLRLG